MQSTPNPKEHTMKATAHPQARCGEGGGGGGDGGEADAERCGIRFSGAAPESN
jgi:hypothetical protein